MTRAYAAVARGGVAVTPYGIRRVTTADGTLLYQHRTDEPRVLVAPWVAAQMTDLLQGVVDAAPAAPPQIGRPAAGKTGTTTSNKDGWFIGFSSGLTTGVWMGRDDNRALPGLAGRPRAGPRLPRFHGPRRRQPAGRAVRDRGGRARLAGRGADDEHLVRAARRRRRCVDADGNPIEPAAAAADRRATGRDDAAARRGATSSPSGSTRTGSTAPIDAAAAAPPPRASRREPTPRAATPIGLTAQRGPIRWRAAPSRLQPGRAGLGSAPSSCSTRGVEIAGRD